MNHELNRVYSNNWFEDHNFSIFSHNFFNNPIKGLEIGCYEAAVKCINVPYSNSWPNDPIANGPLPYDYAAISAYYSNKKKEALEYGQKALDAAPDDERIKGNMKFYLW